MKGFLKIFVAITVLLLLLIPLFLSSHLYGFPLNANPYSEAIEKDLEYLQNLNERTDNLIFIGEMDSIRFLVNEALSGLIDQSRSVPFTMEKSTK